MLLSMGSQRVGHNLATEQSQPGYKGQHTEIKYFYVLSMDTLKPKLIEMMPFKIFP